MKRVLMWIHGCLLVKCGIHDEGACIKFKQLKAIHEGACMLKVRDGGANQPMDDNERMK